MKRTEFIKSIALLIAAPKILGGMKPIEKIAIESAKKVGCYFKITQEMQDDVQYLEWMFNDKTSFLWEGCSKKGIDLSKHFTIQIGYEEDDFTRNLKTVVITQNI